MGGSQVKEHIQSAKDQLATHTWPLVLSLLVPACAFAQTSPFDTGANGLVSFALTIGTPIAVLIIIGLAIAAAVGKMSWGWVIGAIIGIAAIFGSQQIVAWIRSMFGV
jgi:type IV secretion system protein VirB2